MIIYFGLVVAIHGMTSKIFKLLYWYKPRRQTSLLIMFGYKVWLAKIRWLWDIISLRWGGQDCVSSYNTIW